MYVMKVTRFTANHMWLNVNIHAASHKKNLAILYVTGPINHNVLN